MCRHCQSNATHSGGSLSPAPAIPLPPIGSLSPLTADQIPLPLFGDEVGYLLPEIEKRDRLGNVIPPVLIACSSCDEEFEEEELTEHCNGTDRLCSDCMCSCEECSAVYADNDEELQTAYDGDECRRERNPQNLCDSCCWKCADCSSYFYGDGTQNASGEKICSRCGESYSSCEDCHDTIHQDDSHYDENFAEGSFCQSCYETREREYRADNGDDEETETVPAPVRRNRTAARRIASELINSYSYKPAPQFAFAAGEERENTSPAVFYGIELETETGTSSPEHDKAIRGSGLNVDEHFYCKSDSSLLNAGAGGFEIVSHPGTLRYWLSRDWSFTEKLQSLGYESETEHCGFHIHVSRSALSPAQIAKLLIFTRENAGFMKFVSRRVSPTQMEHYAPVESGSTRRIIRKVNGAGGERYAAINLENDNTIEFRLFQGSLSPVVLKRYIAFVACLIEFIRITPLSRLTAGDFRSFLVLSAHRIVGRELARELLVWTRDCELSHAA